MDRGVRRQYVWVDGAVGGCVLPEMIGLHERFVAGRAWVRTGRGAGLSCRRVLMGRGTSWSRVRRMHMVLAGFCCFYPSEIVWSRIDWVRAGGAPQTDIEVFQVARWVGWVHAGWVGALNGFDRRTSLRDQAKRVLCRRKQFGQELIGFVLVWWRSPNRYRGVQSSPLGRMGACRVGGGFERVRSTHRSKSKRSGQKCYGLSGLLVFPGFLFLVCTRIGGGCPGLTWGARGQPRDRSGPGRIHVW